MNALCQRQSLNNRYCNHCQHVQAPMVTNCTPSTSPSTWGQWRFGASSFKTNIACFRISSYHAQIRLQYGQIGLKEYHQVGFESVKCVLHTPQQSQMHIWLTTLIHLQLDLKIEVQGKTISKMIQSSILCDHSLYCTPLSLPVCSPKL